MKPASFVFCMTIATSLLAPLTVQSQATGCARDAMLVFDGSASMAEVSYDASAPTRIDEARRAIQDAIPEIAAVRRVGLMFYGPGGADACTGIDLRFAPKANSAGTIINAVDQMNPSGLTPLTNSVEAAAAVLGNSGIIVLVTDGNETCGGRPCTLGKDLAAIAPDLTVHVIGFRVVFDPFSFNSPEAGNYEGQTVAKCLADQTGGLYVDTHTVDELAGALRQTLGCALIGAKPLDLAINNRSTI